MRCNPENNNFPLIGDTAPKFTAQTTNGIINFPTDYAGHWVVLFSHPMDFTPVCTTEFLAFQSALPEFKKINTELIALSVGAIPSHLAWFRSIYTDIKFQNNKNIKITFPAIADMDLHVSKLYLEICFSDHYVRGCPGFIVQPGRVDSCRNTILQKLLTVNPDICHITS